MLEYHRRMFRYDEWANLEVAAGLERSRQAPGQAVALLAHITAAEALWFDRILGRQSEIQVWPHWALNQCVAESRRTVTQWQEYLAALANSEISREVRYVDSKGKDWASSVDDILTHVVIHSVYHRAQIATVLREDGFAPAFTDFIHATRDQHIK